MRNYVGKRFTTKHVALAAFIITLFGTHAAAQSTSDELRQLRHEIQELKTEVAGLHAAIDALQQSRATGVPTAQLASARAAVQSQTASSKDQVSQPPTPATEQATEADMVPLLQSEVADQAQIKVQSNSRLPVKIFGTLLADTFLAGGPSDQLDLPTFAPDYPVANLGRFNANLRQSRIGAFVDGPQIWGMKTHGVLAVDFWGDTYTGSTSFIGSPRLLYAYARAEGTWLSLEAGQDEMILTPVHPTSLASYAVPALYRSGDLYLYAPQLRLELSHAVSDTSELRLTSGVLAVQPYAYSLATLADTNVPTPTDPAFQSRASWAAKPDQEGHRAWNFGVGWHRGPTHVGGTRLWSWAAAADFKVEHSFLGGSGEYYTGRNIGALGGNSVEYGRASGGFFQATLKPSALLSFNAGYGNDHLLNAVEGVYYYPFQRNAGVFANTIYKFTPEVQTSLEYRRLTTRALYPYGKASNNHLDLVFAYSF